MTADGDNTVYIPEGTFSTFPISSLGYISNIEIIIDGTLLLSKNWRHFQPIEAERQDPAENGYGKYGIRIADMMQFVNCTDIVFRGKGEIDGQGFMWWVRELLKENDLGRPQLIRIENGKNIEFKEIKVRNSP